MPTVENTNNDNHNDKVTKDDLIKLIVNIRDAHCTAAQGYITFQSTYFELTDGTLFRATPKGALDKLVSIGALHSSIWKRAKFTAIDLEKTMYDFEGDKPRLYNLYNVISKAAYTWDGSEIHEDIDTTSLYGYTLALTELYGALDLVNYLINTNYYLNR